MSFSGTNNKSFGSKKVLKGVSVSAESGEAFGLLGRNGAIGSTASKVEDINTSVMPLTFIFIAAFMVVMFSMSAGSVYNVLMRVCSYIPFTSPMAMFTRIAMSTVPIYEIIISVVILIASVIGIGVISAKIYRVGVLLYGTPPKLGAIFKAIRKS